MNIVSKKLIGFIAVFSLLLATFSGIVASANTGTVNANQVNFRQKPTTSAKIIKRVGKGTKITVISKKGSWYKVRLSGKVGYINARYAKRTATTSNRGSDRPSKGERAVEYAKQFIGVRYNYGHTSPSEGFDCSGMIYYVYKHFGITLNRSSSGMANNGRKILASDLQPGDILLFKQHGGYDHSAIYIGDGKMIHAETHAGVNINVLMDNGYYEKSFAKAVRIF